MAPSFRQMDLGAMYVPEGTLPALMGEAAKVGYRPQPYAATRVKWARACVPLISIAARCS